MMKRREFLIGTSSAVVLAGLRVGSVLAASDPAAGFSTSLGKSEWTALLNQDFRLWLSSSTSLVLTLTAVTEQATMPNAVPRLDQFTLTFTGDPSEPLAEGTYTMSQIMQPAAGNFFLHLQPVGSDASQSLYRSDFSLLT